MTQLLAKVDTPLPVKTVKSNFGRPTKYKRDMIEQARDYIDNYEELGHKIPTIAGLSQVLETDRETISEWASHEDKQDFSRMVRQLQRSQELALVNNGLDGTYNSGITKLILSKHGYSDNQPNQGVSISITVNRGVTEVVAGDKSVVIEHVKD